MRRLSTILVPVLIIGFLLLSGTMFTLSYLSDRESHINSFSVGSADVEVVENFTPPVSATQTQEFEKDIRVKNTGTAPAFVRIYLGISDQSVAQKTSVQTDSATWHSFTEDLKSNLPDGWVYVDASDADGDVLGGFFYYTAKLEEGQETPSLVKRFKIAYASQEEAASYWDTGIDIDVYAESVSTLDRHGASFEGADAYRKAWKEFLAEK